MCSIVLTTLDLQLYWSILVSHMFWCIIKKLKDLNITFLNQLMEWAKYPAGRTPAQRTWGPRFESHCGQIFDSFFFEVL